jgi:hypothetical protein
MLAFGKRVCGQKVCVLVDFFGSLEQPAWLLWLEAKGFSASVLSSAQLSSSQQAFWTAVQVANKVLTTSTQGCMGSLKSVQMD